MSRRSVRRAWAVWRPLVMTLGLCAWLDGGLDAGFAAERPRVWVQLPAGYAEGPEDDPAMAVAGEVLVRFRTVAAGRRIALAQGLGGSVRWLTPGVARGGGGAVAPAGQAPGRAVDAMAVVRLPRGTDLLEGLKELAAREDVLYAEPNLRLKVCVERSPLPTAPAPTDFEFTRQWALHNAGQTGGTAGADIGALEAWAVTTGSRDIVVAIIDTGIDYFHPDLEANIWRNPREIPGNGLDDDGNGYVDDVHGYDLVSDDGDPMDDNLHGTHVAGILAAVGNDENGIAGVAWSAGLMALKAFDETGGGSLDDTVSAIAYAEAAGARVINASWGTTTRSRALDEAVAEAVQRGVVVVAAAGNNGSDVSFHPAAVPEAIAVGSTDARDLSSTFSNHGPFVDVVAPGDLIHSTAPNAHWTLLSGTSMAAPHVSGLAVLLLSRRPEFTPGEIRAIVQSTTDEVRGDRFTGAGRVHAGRAVQISEPLPLAVLERPAFLSGRVDLLGEAGGNGFAGYRLEIGLGTRPDSWTEIAASASPSVGGVVAGAFDTSRFDDGDYSLRLSVTNAAGQAAIARAVVSIRNVRLASPANNDVWRRGDSIELRGTVFGDGRAFEISWGLGRQPTEWFESGVSRMGGGQAPRIDELLATWDPRVAGLNQFVTFRLVARDGGRTVGEAFARMVHLEERLRPGWPRSLPFREEFPEASWREFNVADLDGDGGGEVILVDHGEPGGRAPRLKVLGPDGSERWGRDLPAGAPEHDAPVVGDIDGDGRLEVFVDTGAGGAIQGFTATGEPLGGAWPVAPGGDHFGKVVADLDGDGRAELVVLSNPPADLVGAPQRRLAVLDGTGAILARWTLASCPDPMETPVPELLPAVGNLDSDPELEVVVVDGCLGVSAYAISRPDGPVWTSVTEARIVASPVVGDLDGDGTEEVVVGGVSRGPGLPGGVHVIGADGRPRPGWPALREESFHGAAALADLDGDDWLEIVIASWDSRTVHVLGIDGFELRGWPLPAQTSASTRSIPILGDVDGDGAPDVVLASPGFWLQVLVGGDTSRAGGVKAWRTDGTLIDFHPGFPTEGLVTEAVGGAIWNRLPPAALADLDGDGRLDIVAGTVRDRAYSPTPPVTTTKDRSTLYAWELNVPYQPGAMPWPMFQGGPGRTGRYVRPVKPNRPPVLRNIPDQTVAIGDGFRIIRLDRYGVDPDGPQERLTWSVLGSRELSVTLSEAREATVEAPSPDWEGTESLEFVVRDPAGGEAREIVVFSARAGYRPPTAGPDEFRTDEEVAIEFDVLGNDRSPTGRPLSVAGVSSPGFGVTRILPDGRIRYEPAVDYFGVDSFEYALEDDDGGTAVGEVRVRVDGVADYPVTEVDRLVLDEDTTGEVAPLENDHDPDLDDIELIALDPPTAGSWVEVGPARYRFVPPPDWSGVQVIPYRVKDPSGLVATGEVAVLVRPVNDPPILRDQEIVLNRNKAADVFYDARDADGDVLRYTIVDGPLHGVLLAYPNIANYAPETGFSGSDQFTYTATDGRVTVGPATVSLRVGAANNPPEVESMETVTAVDQDLELGLPVRDADGDAVALRVTTLPGNGEVVLDGTNAVYRPAPGFLGEDRFGYRAADGFDESVEGEIRIRVTDENTPPVARSEVLTVARNGATPVRLVATDGENNPLRFLVVTNPAFGILEGEAPSVVYRPRANFRGLDRLTFLASDRWSTSEVAVVHLLVRDPNQVPVATNQTVEVLKDRASPLELAVTDADGHELRVAVLKGPRFGRVYGLGSRLMYQPRPGYQGFDSFTYKAWDGFGYSGVGTVSVLVVGEVEARIEITQVTRTADGVELSVRGGAGKTLRIEVSFDLEHWETAARVPGGAEVVRWLDAGSGGGVARFYRVAEDVFGAFP
ncbi:MAG: Ig-like domain-containing protein [Limisphaerales bacterium]